MADDNKTFEIGLAMAGAISAGAYSAGVADFLFQALDEWYTARAADPSDYPSHDVVLKVISGASAGAITAVLAAAAIRFAKPTKIAETDTTAGYTLQAMYDAWVINADFLPRGKCPGLLSTDDLKPGTTVTSLLNSRALDSIGNLAFGYAPTPCTLRTVPYLSEHLHVYLMLTNLRGVPYEVQFTGPPAGSGYGMLNHADRSHFIVTNLGTATQVSQWDTSDPGTPLDVRELPGGQAESGDSWASGPWQVCLDAALASSAFPVGFSPRPMTIAYTDYGPRQWPFEHTAANLLKPDFPTSYTGDTDKGKGSYSFTCIDGGLINNEPFEYAHYALLEPGVAHNDATGAGASRAVVMIDPFPELPGFKSRNTQKSDLISVLATMFFDLKDQARFKASELVAALDDTCYSRFLIGPRRDVTLPPLPGPATKPYPTDNAIASGLLSGFGGFVSQLFRDHDYQLGRANCYDFLRTWFVLDGANPLFSDWPANAVANDSFRPAGEPPEGQRCIIPLVGACATKPKLLVWPLIGDDVLGPIFDAMTNRAEVLFPLFRAGLSGRFARWGAGLVWTLGVKSYLLRYAQWKIKSDLIKRGQYNAFEQLGSVAECNALGVLADPECDYYTAAYVADAINVPDIAVVVGILQDHQKAGRVTYDSALEAWTLTARAPSMWQKIRDQVAIGPPTVGAVDPQPTTGA